MKKLITVFATAAIALALSAPVFAKAPAKGKAQSDASTTQAPAKHKSHKLHLKKGSKSKKSSKTAATPSATK